MPWASSAEKSPVRIAWVGTVCGSGSGNWSYSHSTAPKKNVRSWPSYSPGTKSGPPAVPPGRLYFRAGVAAGTLVLERRLLAAGLVDEEVGGGEGVAPVVGVSGAGEAVGAALQRD